MSLAPEVQILMMNKPSLTCITYFKGLQFHKIIQHLYGITVSSETLKCCKNLKNKLKPSLQAFANPWFHLGSDHDNITNDQQKLSKTENESKLVFNF